MKSTVLSKPAIILISRYVLAVLFIFSGLAKGLNPFGLSIQLTEYLSVTHLDFLTPTAPLMAIIIPATEAMLGFMLILGLGKRITAWAAMSAMCFFTLLTLWIVIYNPVKDCGCFGDLIKISNTATFVKNLILLIPSLILFINRNNYNATNTKKKPLKWGLAIVLSFALPVYTTFTLPMIDATPFKTGVNILSSMEIPEGAPTAVQKTTLIYRDLQNGQKHEFALTDTTWYDSARWEFVDSHTETITEGYTPPIASFPMIGPDGADHHQQILETPRLLIIATTKPAEIPHIQTDSSIRTVVITSAPLEQVPEGYQAYNSDYSLIRTMLQHPKGGAILLKNGTITRKWAMPRIPNTIN